MMTLTKDLVRELEALRDSGFAEWLAGSLAELRDAGDYLDGPDMHRNQGRCQILKEISDHIQDSGKYLERYKVQEQ